MQLPGTFNDLIEQVQKGEHYKNLVLQLNKDFALASVHLDLQTSITPERLKAILHETIFSLIRNNFPDYLNLLYVVDVSEEKIKALDGSDALKLSEHVSFLILQRVWQKVWFRHFY
ncbi:MAG: hypothetical protein AAF688_09335 [Bacteroidota bacterium]